MFKPTTEFQKCFRTLTVTRTHCTGVPGVRDECSMHQACIALHATRIMPNVCTPATTHHGNRTIINDIEYTLNKGTRLLTLHRLASSPHTFNEGPWCWEQDLV